MKKLICASLLFLGLSVAYLTDSNESEKVAEDSVSIPDDCKFTNYVGCNVKIVKNGKEYNAIFENVVKNGRYDIDLSYVLEDYPGDRKLEKSIDDALIKEFLK